jgi:hypothetical protein
MARWRRAAYGSELTLAEFIRRTLDAATLRVEQAAEEQARRRAEAEIPERAEKVERAADAEDAQRVQPDESAPGRERVPRHEQDERADDPERARASERNPFDFTQKHQDEATLLERATQTEPLALPGRRPDPCPHRVPLAEFCPLCDNYIALAQH